MYKYIPVDSHNPYNLVAYWWYLCQFLMDFYEIFIN